MNITEEVYQQILNFAPAQPPEVGGLLGGQNGIVCQVFLDTGHAANGCSYAPDVMQMNQTIRAWSEKGIAFFGIFHTHFFDVDTLSDGDRQYIRHIMEAMPPTIKHLYFPLVVLPERRMVVYQAAFTSGRFTITRDDLQIGGQHYEGTKSLERHCDSGRML